MFTENCIAFYRSIKDYLVLLEALWTGKSQHFYRLFLILYLFIYPLTLEGTAVTNLKVKIFLVKK